MNLDTFSKEKQSQRHDELQPFIELLQNEKVNRYLEIGARQGDTFHAVMRNLTMGAFGCAVDLPAGEWGRVGTEVPLLKAQRDLIKHSYDVDVVLGDSHSKAVRNRVNRHSPFDCVLIDGDHSYRAVKLDWMDYGPMANMVAFHDIDGHDQINKRNRHPVEVPRLWEELKPLYRHVEFIGKERGMGIGVLWIR